MRPWTNKTVAYGILGIILALLGASFCLFWQTIFRQILQNGLSLTPSSKSYDIWADTSNLPPIHLKIYFFNWTNPEELKIPGKKPILVEVGPYSFLEVKKKVNITFNPGNNTVSYFQQRFWYFDPKNSNGSLQDNITQLNAVALSAAHKVRYWSFLMQNTLSYVLRTAAKIYVVKTVDELLFAGYDDPVIKMGRLAVPSEDVPPYDRFGWFYLRNGSTTFDGHFNMDTGVDDISKLGNLRKWNYKDSTKYFDNRPCNIVEGSAGEFWPPERTKEDISLFSVDLCRPLTYEFLRNVSHYGIEGYQYTIGAKTLGNDTRRRYPHEQAKYMEPTTTTENFFVAEHSAEATDSPGSDNLDEDEDEETDVINMGRCLCNGECSPSGVLNITSCRYGAPAFVSLPHFFMGDPVLRDGVVGMEPDEEKHRFYITLEPTTGIPLDVGARLQVNLLLQSSKIVSLFKNVPKIYFPMFWFSVNVKVTEDMASELKILLSLPSMFVYSGLIVLIIGLFIVITLALLHLMKKQRQKAAMRPVSKTETSKEAEGIKNGKTIEAIPEKKSELVYMDKLSANEDGHVRSDRRLYPKLY